MKVLPDGVHEHLIDYVQIWSTRIQYSSGSSLYEPSETYDGALVQPCQTGQEPGQEGRCQIAGSQALLNRIAWPKDQVITGLNH